VAEYFDIKPKQANEIVTEASNAVADWRKQAKRLGVPAREIDRMATAFEHKRNQ
jgi:serine/threonine-protein kinase HipA